MLILFAFCFFFFYTCEVIDLSILIFNNVKLSRTWIIILRKSEILF